MITMKKWGSKSEIGMAMLLIGLGVDAIFDLNPYFLLVISITTILLMLSSVYDWYKNKKNK